MGILNASDFSHLPPSLLTTLLIPVLSKSSSATTPHSVKGRVSQSVLKARLKGTGLLRQRGILPLPWTVQADLD